MIMGFFPFMIFFANVILFFMASQLPMILHLLTYLPTEIEAVLVDNIHRIFEARSTIWMAVGLLTGLWASAQGVQVMIQSSDQAFHEDRNKQNWFILKFKSMLFMILLVLSIIISLGLTVFGNALVYGMRHIFDLPSIFFTLWDWAKYGLPFTSLITTLTFFYRFSPCTYRPKWSRTFLISILVTAIWLIATSAYSYYMLHISAIGVTYGSLVGLIALFIWFRLIAIAIIIGNEILMTWNDLDIIRSHGKS
jgi:membrane protein